MFVMQATQSTITPTSTELLKPVLAESEVGNRTQAFQLAGLCGNAPSIFAQIHAASATNCEGAAPGSDK